MCKNAWFGATHFGSVLLLFEFARRSLQTALTHSASFRFFLTAALTPRSRKKGIARPRQQSVATTGTNNHSHDSRGFVISACLYCYMNHGCIVSLFISCCLVLQIIITYEYELMFSI